MNPSFLGAENKTQRKLFQLCDILVLLEAFSVTDYAEEVKWSPRKF